MKRSFFLLGFAAAAVMLTMRTSLARRARPRSCPDAGRCADNRRKLRWSGYTAADFT